MNKKGRSLEWYFIEMIESILSLQIYVQDLSSEEFLKKKILKEAVVRNFEVLGEAANHVPAEARKDFPDVPWRNMIGMRNILIHDYFEISYQTMWETIRSDLPETLKAIKAMYAALIELTAEKVDEIEEEILFKIKEQL